MTCTHAAICGVLHVCGAMIPAGQVMSVLLHGFTSQTEHG